MDTPANACYTIRSGGCFSCRKAWQSASFWRRTRRDSWSTTRPARWCAWTSRQKIWRSMGSSSLRASIRELEADLTAKPMRISAYHDLPFAILRYDPEEEWSLRREAKHLATRLHNAGKRVQTVSLVELLWKAIDDAEGL